MFDFLFNPQGRISRKGWWLAFTLPYLAATILPPVLQGVFGELGITALAVLFGLIGTLLGLFYLWPSVVAVPVKRFHDLGMTGFWQLGFVAAEIVLVIAFFVGVGLYAVREGLEDEIASLGSLAPEEQGAAMVALLGPAMGHPVVLVSLVLLIVVNLVWLYFQGIKRGQVGENVHGQDPHASGRGFAD